MIQILSLQVHFNFWSFDELLEFCRNIRSSLGLGGIESVFRHLRWELCMFEFLFGPEAWDYVPHCPFQWVFKV